MHQIIATINGKDYFLCIQGAKYWLSEKSEDGYKFNNLFKANDEMSFVSKYHIALGKKDSEELVDGKTLRWRVQNAI